MITTEAWLIHQRPLRETSVELTLFTEAYGLIRAQCRGGLRKWASVLQPFIPLWVTLIEKRQVFFANQLELNGPCYSLSGLSLFSGLYCNELLYYLLPQQEAEIGLFQSYQTLIKTLSLPLSQEALETQLRLFEWELLNLSGFGVSLSHTPDGMTIMPEQYYGFKSDGLYLIKHQVQGYQGAHLLAFLNHELSPLVLATMKRFMRQLLSHALGGRELHSRMLLAGLQSRDC